MSFAQEEYARKKKTTRRDKFLAEMNQVVPWAALVEPERWGMYTFTFGASGHALMSIYFDQEQDLETAKVIWLSLTDKHQ